MLLMSTFTLPYKLDKKYIWIVFLYSELIKTETFFDFSHHGYDEYHYKHAIQIFVLLNQDIHIETNLFLRRIWIYQ